MANIIDFIKTFDCPELGIKNEGKIITFIKNDKSYSIELHQHKDTIEFRYVDKNNLDYIHFTEILNKQDFKTVNDIPDLLEFIKSLNVNHYCICCHNRLDFQSDSYIACSNDDCQYKYEEIIVGNKVIEKVKDDPMICEFLIQSAIDAINSGREYDIFEPFPMYFMLRQTKVKRGKMSKLEGENYDHLKDFSRIKKLIDTLDINNFITQCSQYKTDFDLSNKIGKELYILIRFILMSCKVEIQKNDDLLGIQSDHYTIYKIGHPMDKEEEFKGLIGDQKTGFLFHGSRWGNWFSILRNGLKNCSGSKLMTAGQAYGSGIYLSGDINVSYGYGLSTNHKSVVGVFEVINKDKYSKSGHQVYVVDDDKMLIQRYLLIIPSKNANYLTEINNIFNKKIYVEKSNAEVKYNQKSIAKIIREYKQLMKSKDTLPFRIEVNNDHPFLWKIFIHKFDDKYPIAQDMKKFKVKEIEMEIRFPTNYPFESPFVRVVSPRFMHLTAHITTGGSICNELLTPRGWIATCSVESLITVIISEIIEGDGKLDPQKYHIPYSYEEAKESFVRVARSHGWM